MHAAQQHSGIAIWQQASLCSCCNPATSMPPTTVHPVSYEAALLSLCGVMTEEWQLRMLGDTSNFKNKMKCHQISSVGRLLSLTGKVKGGMRLRTPF